MEADIGEDDDNQEVIGNTVKKEEKGPVLPPKVLQKTEVR